MPERDREQSVEHVLRRVLAESASVPKGACLDGETVAAWTTGSLHPDEASAVENHIADCARCQALMAAFVRTTPAIPATESLWTRWRLGWVVPLATAATAAALWVALPGSGPVPLEPQQKATAEIREGPGAAAPPATPPAAPARVAPAPSVPSERSASTSEQLQDSPRTPASNERRERASAADEPASLPPPSIAQRSEAAVDQRAPAAAPLTRTAEVDQQELGASQRTAAFAARQAPTIEIVAPGGAARWQIANDQRVEWSSSTSGEWTPASIGEGTFLAGSAPSASVCWIVGRGGAIYLTTNGTRFVRIAFPEMVDLVAATATDDRTAVVTGADGRSWSTRDQGLTWSMGR